MSDGAVRAIDHVQLAMPAGGEAAARAFYDGLLGFPEQQKPPHLAARGGCWFESSKVKIHLGVDRDFRPARKAHPALLVDGLPALLARLAAVGVRIVDDEPLAGYDRVYVDDPFGNRIELMEPSAPAATVNVKEPPAIRADQYDAFADAFADHAEDSPYNALYDRPATLRLLGEVAGRTVLDAGCGPGIYAEELLRRDAAVIGFDASPRMIELARARVGDRADLRVHSLDDPLSWLPDESIDLVLSALAWHYVSNRAALLAELRRVLRPDGAVVISTHHPVNDWRRLGGSYFAVGGYVETWKEGWEVAAWRLPLTTIVGEFADAGFVVERLVEPQPEPSMAQSHPRKFAVLSAVPAFVLFRLRLAAR